MKKSIYMVLAALALVGCAKEAERMDAPALLASRTVTITAGFDESTKTSYDQDGKFSWVEGDKIGVLVSNGTETKQLTFVAQASGATATFSGEVEEGYELTGLASYPFNQEDAIVCNDLAWDDEKQGWRIWGSIEPSLEAPLSCIPLIGQREGNSMKYAFKTAVGIVKFTVTNVPLNTAFAYLEVPEDTKAQYNLNGWYTLSEEGTLLMENAIEPWENRNNWNAPSEANATMEYYFFLPVGKLPKGTKFQMYAGDYSLITSKVFQKDVEVVRNKIVNIATVELEEQTVFTLEDILGTYDMEVTEGSYSSNHAVGDLVIEESDDPSQGNIMITKFAGVSGKQYGNFDGINMLVFSCDQIFGNNPYDDADTWPYVALDFYTGTVVDPTFEVLEPGKIQALADAIGFRGCTEESWFDDHGGSWPWELCYGSLTATWQLGAYWLSIGTGRFRDNFVWPIAGLEDYVSVTFQQDMNHDTRFRIEKPYPGDSDPWFEFDIADPDAVTSVPYFVDVEVTAEGKATYKPWVRNGDYGYNFSDVLRWQIKDALPAIVEIGPCYRGDDFLPDYNYDYEIGRDHQELAIEIVFPGCEPYDPNVYYKGEEIKLSADMITAAGTINWDGGGIPALCDGNSETYWHTDWYYAVTDNDPIYGEWIDIALKSEIDAAQFKYQVRVGNSGAKPYHVVYGASNDGQNWTQVGEIASDEMKDAPHSAWVELPAISLGGNYKYLRFGIVDTSSPEEGSLTGDLNWEGTKKSANLAELKLFYADI